jgi:hypothetical protein
MALADDPQTLANIITALGGQPIEARTFRFELPAEKVREVVPKINQLGLGVRRISERSADDPRGSWRVHNLITVELYRPDANKENSRLPEGFGIPGGIF